MKNGGAHLVVFSDILLLSNICVFQKRLNELHSLWDQLFFKLKDKGIRLQQALKLLQFLRQCDEVLYWIRDKEAFVTAEDFGVDLEHVEV